MAAWGLVPIPWRRLLAIVLVALTAVVVALALARVLRDDDAPPARLVPASGEPPGSGAEVVDPLAWTEDRSDYLRRGRGAGARPSPLRAEPGRRRWRRRAASTRYRPVVESGRRGRRASTPTRSRRWSFLESAGRPGRRRGPASSRAPSDLTQILAETGRNLLGMTGRSGGRAAHRALHPPQRAA